MKKIIIAILLVFSCGLLALIIPKKASALQITDIVSDDGTMNSYLDSRSHYFEVNVNDADYYYSNYYHWHNSEDGLNFKITNFYYHVNYYNSWHITALTFDYCYWIDGVDFLGTGLFDYGVGEVWFDTGLTQNLDSFVESDLPLSLLFYFEFELSLLSVNDTHAQFEFSLYSEVNLPSVSYAENVLNDYIEIPLSPNLYEQYYGIFQGFEFSPTILIYAYMYSHDMIAYTFPVYIDGDTDFLGFIQNATSGFLETEIIGSISIADILLFIVSVALLIFLLRFFAGG